MVILSALIALALVAGVIYTIWLVGAETMKVILFLVVGGGILALLLYASKHPIQAWRSNVQPEAHIYHERETRHIPVPHPAVLPQLPQLSPPTAQASQEVYPELLRAAFLAGATGVARAPLLGSEPTPPAVSGWPPRPWPRANWPSRRGDSPGRLRTWVAGRTTMPSGRCAIRETCRYGLPDVF